MKLRALLILCLLAILPGIVSAQTTSVSGTVTDTDPQIWFGGTYQFSFQPSPVNPAGPYFQNGVPFNTAQVIAGGLNGSGAYTAVVPDNATIAPSGSTWNLQVCPFATAACFNIQKVTITGASQTLNATPPGVRVNMQNPPLVIRAYADLEVSTGAVVGTLYYNVTSSGYRVCQIVSGNTCTTWATIGTGGGGTPCIITPNSFQKNLAGSFGCTNVAESGTTLTVDDDEQDKGPNPWFDIMRYGGYVGLSNAPVTTTGSISSASAILTLAAAQDFVNGHGIVVYLAGLLPLTRNASFPPAPAVGTVTPVGVINGATTYQYKYVLEDYFGGLTPAGAQGQTTTGAATLGTNTVGIDSMTRVNGLDTYHCTSNCNVGVSSQVQVTGFVGGGNSNVNGTVVVNTTPDATHFTVFASGLQDYAESASGTLSVKACNDIFPSGTLAVESVILRTWIYRGGTLVGVAPGQDPYFRDCGQGVTGQPSYVPTSTPGAAQAGYLATTICAGGGTTTLTLCNAAGTTASSQTVFHDNDPALKAAYTAALAAHGGVVRIPVIAAGGFSTFPFNSTTDLTTISNPTDSHVRIEFATVLLAQPWIPAITTEIVGLPQSETSFEHVPLGIMSGTAHPLILNNGFTSNSVAIERVKFVCLATGQTSMLMDEAVGSGGRVGFNLTDNGYCGNSASALVIKGGFDFWFTRGVCGVSGGTWDAPPCIRFTNGTTYLTGGPGSQVAGLIYFEKPNFQGGTAIQMDNIPNPILSSGGGNITVDGALHESNSGAFLRIFLANASFAYGANLRNAVQADQVNGLHQPLLELTGTTNFPNITLERNIAAGSNPLVLGGGSVAAPVCIDNIFFGCGSTPFRNILNAGIDTVDGGVVGAQSGGSMGYLMGTPAAPASCIVSAGGSVPITTGLQYFIAAANQSPVNFTPYQGVTVIGPACTVNTTSGQQTVTVTRPTLPVGATGWLVWRGGGEANMPGTCQTPIPVTTTTYVDTSSFGCGVSAPPYTTALTSGISSTGIATNQLTFSSVNGISVWSGIFTAPRAVSIPDASGTAMVFSGGFANNDCVKVVSSGGVTTFASAGSGCGGSGSSAFSALTGGTNTVATMIVGTGASLDFTGSGTIHASTADKWTTARSLAGNSVDGSAPVPFTNKFIVQGTTDAGLTGAQFLGALTTGILKNTTTTGVLSIANAADVDTLYTGAGKCYLFKGTSPGSNDGCDTPSAGSVSWSSIGVPSTNLTLSMGSNLSEFDTTSALAQFFSWKNKTAAVVGTSQGSPFLALCGRAFHASADVEDCMTFSELPGNGNDAAISFNINHTGTSTGVVTTSFPGPVAIPQAGGVGGMVSMTEGTVPASLGAAGQDNFYADSTAHTLLAKLNNGSTIPFVFGPASSTNNDVAAFSGTGGGLLQDAGFTFGNVVRKDAANTGLAAMTLDMSASTSAAAFRAPNIAGASSTTNGVMSYDTTNKNIHMGSNGVDNINALIPSSISPANNDCAKWTLASGVLTLNTAGAACGSGSSVLSSITAAVGSNTIANGNNPQTWNWVQTTDSQTAFKFGETSAATNGTLTSGFANQVELGVATASASTASPFSVVQGSITGTVAFPAAQIQTTWNNASLTAIGFLFNATDTSSNAASLLADFRKGGTSQWKIDKSGNSTQLGAGSFGSSPPACTAGTSGALCLGEGTDATNASGASLIDANSTTHEFTACTNGSTTCGMLQRVQPGAIHQTAKIASIGTATLCAASAGACNVAGQYHVSWDFIETGTACSVVTAGNVTFTLSYTDTNGTAHAHVLPMIGEGAIATTPALSQSFFFQTSLANAFAHGDATISTNGTVIQYATTYTACTTGTGTYQLDAVVERVQ